MGWAGALEGIFETYAADFNAKPLNLYQNFRSAPRLRRMQNAMVRVMDPPAALGDDELQGDDGEIEIIRFNNATEEATHLADAISSIPSLKVPNDPSPFGPKVKVFVGGGIISLGICSADGSRKNAAGRASCNRYANSVDL
jgi:hypothetical protein